MTLVFPLDSRNKCDFGWEIKRICRAYINTLAANTLPFQPVPANKPSTVFQIKTVSLPSRMKLTSCFVQHARGPVWCHAQSPGLQSLRCGVLPAWVFARPFLALDKSTVTLLLPRDLPPPSLKLSAHFLSTQDSECSYSSHPSTSQDESSCLMLALKVEWCHGSHSCWLRSLDTMLWFLSRLFSKYQPVGVSCGKGWAGT